LGDMPWISRATATWPDSRYLASDEGDVNTGKDFAIVIAGCALRSVVIDPRIADDAKLCFGCSPACILMEQSPIFLFWGIGRLPVRRCPSKLCAALGLSRRLRLDGTDLPHPTVFMRVPTRPRCVRCCGASLRLDGFRSWPCHTQ
jgi:hypothetical protein